MAIYSFSRRGIKGCSRIMSATEREWGLSPNAHEGGRAGRGLIQSVIFKLIAIQTKIRIYSY